MSKIRSKVPALLEGKTFSLDDTAYSEKEVYNKVTIIYPSGRENFCVMLMSGEQEILMRCCNMLPGDSAQPQAGGDMEGKI
eukprot:1394154-Amorphochlora_amoeboformis.AAC.1